MEKYVVFKEFPRYSVSNLGNVINNETNKPIKKVKNRKGYFTVGLIYKGKKKSFLVHRMVAKEFIKNPFEKNQVNHINGIKTDNTVENLEWCTHKENINHAFENKLINNKKRVFIKKGDEYLEFESTSDCSRFLNVNNGNIGNILNGNRKTVKGYVVGYL